MKKSDVQILVVDDEESVRNSLVASITRAGFSALSASNAKEAKSIVQVKSINGAIIDCMLPMINGVDLAVDLKTNMTSDAPITLMSGIYKDSTFAEDAIRKTQAVQFLHKPIDMASYIEQLEKTFSSKIEKPKVAIHALLANPEASNRQQQKALEQIEEMTGSDIPFLISLFMGAESSGHLTLYTEEEELYGVSMAKGNLCSIDMPNKDKTVKELLVELGFTDDVEVNAFTTKNPDIDIVEGMIAENLLSPHVRKVIQVKRLEKEFEELTRLGNLKVSFAFDRKAKLPNEHLSLKELAPILRNIILRNISAPFLQNFYSEWRENPIRQGQSYHFLSEVIAFPEMVQLEKCLRGHLGEEEEEVTLKELLQKEGAIENNLIYAVHLCASLRIVVFGKQTNKEQIKAKEQKIKKMYDSLNGKDPYEVFAFFGLSKQARKTEIEHTYREFAKTNHPDKIGKGLTEEALEINNKLFSLVTSAYDILTDQEKKDEFEESIRRRAASSQLKAENIIASGQSLMSKDQYKEALEQFKLADSTYSTDESVLGVLWASIKLAQGRHPEEIVKRLGPTLDRLDARALRKNPYFLFVRGLYYKTIGLGQEAASDFSSALDLDPNYILARRELSSLKSTSSKNTNKSILTADLSTVISGLFKGKKK